MGGSTSNIRYRMGDIDHIIPRTGAQGEREKLVKDLLGQQALDLGYDYDVPANLAPICPTPCNREKRADLFRSARFEGLLRRARKKAEGVVRFVESYRSPDRVQAALMAVTMADLSDQRANESIPGAVHLDEVEELLAGLVALLHRHEFEACR